MRVPARYSVAGALLLTTLSTAPAGSTEAPAPGAAERYGVPAYQILKRVGERGYVGGQEDMIIDVALDLVKQAETQRAQGGSPRRPLRLGGGS